jgi:hemerythrin
MEVPFLAWMDEYEVGHKGLDAEHRQLVATINEIYSAEWAKQTPHQLSLLLDTLKLATIEHFKHENSVMREIGDGAYPSTANGPAFLQAMGDATINEHCAEHAKAFLKLEAIIGAVHSQTDSDEQSLSRNLMNWFIEHATKCDVHLKEFFRTE